MRLKHKAAAHRLGDKNVKTLQRRCLQLFLNSKAALNARRSPPSQATAQVKRLKRY